MNFIRIFLAVLLASPLGTLCAQDAATTEINAKIAVYIWAKGSFGDEVDRDGNIIFKYTPPEVKFADASGKVVDMDVYPNRRTPFMKYKGSPNIQFFRDVKLKGQDQAIRQPVGQITLPATTRSALLMFYPLNPEMTTFNVFPLTDVAETIPAGKALVFNTCPFDVGVQMGGERGFQLAAQKRQFADLKPKDYFLQFQFWVRNKNEWSKVYSSKKAIHPESSLILIIHPRENNPRLVDMLALSAS